MAIDASIYGQLQPVQFESPINALAKVTQLKNAQNQNRLFDMQVADSERTRSNEMALNDAYRGATGADGSIDRNKLYSSLAQGGQGAKLPGIQKGFSDQDKSSKEAELANLKAAREKQGIIAQVAGAAKDQESWLRGKAQLQQMGVDVSQVPDQFDPRIAATLVQQSLTGVQQLDKAFKEKEFSYRQQNDAANRGVTMRGQNMTDARGRDLAAATREAGGAGRAPSGYRFTQDGSLEPIKGGPADPGNKSAKATTEGEKAAAGYGLRMVEAEKVIDAIGAKDPKSQKPSVLERVAGDSGFANLTRDNNRQQYRQAQEDWVRSKLRKESGAAIPTDEMDREIQTYFPQIGEKADVIEQKRKARATATKAMGIAAGGAESQMRNGEPASNLPKSGAVVDGYRFKGGNPADKSNWEKQ